MSEEIREAFEKWHEGYYNDGVSRIRKTFDGYYIDQLTSHFSNAYTAGHKSRDPEIHQLKTDLDENIERTKEAELNAKIWQDKNKRLEAENREFEKGYHLDSHIIREVEAENKKLREALEQAIKTLESVEIHVKSGERINKPTGERWFDDRIKEHKQALKTDDKGGE